MTQDVLSQLEIVDKDESREIIAPCHIRQDGMIYAKPLGQHVTDTFIRAHLLIVYHDSGPREYFILEEGTDISIPILKDRIDDPSFITCIDTELEIMYGLHSNGHFHDGWLYPDHPF